MFRQFITFARNLYVNVVPFVESVVDFLSYQPPGFGGTTIFQIIISAGIGVYLGFALGKWIVGID